MALKLPFFEKCGPLNVKKRAEGLSDLEMLLRFWKKLAKIQSFGKKLKFLRFS